MSEYRKEYKHDPDDDDGCCVCPLFDSGFRRMWCSALARELEGEVTAPPDCPLRSGPITVVVVPG